MRPKFTAALSATAKIWGQPKYALRSEWIKKMWYTHTLGYYSATEEEGDLALCDNMHAPRGY